jgi:hypothetical protein
MGMFDSIHCSYDLGAGFYDRTLQTKDLYNQMMEYWLSPSGELYEIDFSGTQSWVLQKEDIFPYERLTWAKNGCHGKVRATHLTKEIEVYPAKWNAHYAPFPRKTLTIVEGKLFH